MKSHAGLQKGMALIAVLWLTAAMGLIISGIVREVRSEAHSVGFARNLLRARMQADAALLLVLQKIKAEQIQLQPSMQQINVNFEGQMYPVQITPLNGLIDINRASAALLTKLYQHAAQLDSRSATTLAQATVDSRQSKNAKGELWEFQSTEDLLRVKGMTYFIYAKIKSLVTAELRSGSGLVNPLAASQTTLELLLDGDRSRASAFVAQRQSNLKPPDSSFFNPEFIQMTPSECFSLQTKIMLTDGDILQKSINTQWTPDPRSGLPWRILSTQEYISSALAERPAS